MRSASSRIPSETAYSATPPATAARTSRCCSTGAVAATAASASDASGEHPDPGSRMLGRSEEVRGRSEARDGRERGEADDEQAGQPQPRLAERVREQRDDPTGERNGQRGLLPAAEEDTLGGKQSHDPRDPEHSDEVAPALDAEAKRGEADRRDDTRDQGDGEDVVEVVLVAPRADLNEEDDHRRDEPERASGEPEPHFGEREAQRADDERRGRKRDGARGRVRDE